jgi:L-alanine-DL-glutamate epimerase-like enolase superfamily enzyme
MKRRNFIQTISGATAVASLSVNPMLGYALGLTSNVGELDYHAIEKVTFKKVRINYPRFVGKNAIKKNHGWGYDEAVCELITNKGAKGWGVVSRGDSEKEVSEYLIGKKVSALFLAERGIIDPIAARCDIALHDLAGNILNKPVYEIMGAAQPETTHCYSGMIYCKL